MMRLPPYSTDIAAAWEIVAHLEKHPYFVKWEIRSSDMENSQGESPSAYICLGRGIEWKSGQSAPHAICLAALKAVGVEV